MVNSHGHIQKVAEFALQVVRIAAGLNIGLDCRRSRKNATRQVTDLDCPRTEGEVASQVDPRNVERALGVDCQLGSLNRSVAADFDRDRGTRPGASAVIGLYELDGCS